MCRLNLSDQPDGVKNYAIDKLVGDVDAVVRHIGQSNVMNTMAASPIGPFAEVMVKRLSKIVK